MELCIFGETVSIARLAGDAPVPAWIGGREFLAIVRTHNELSIVCRDDAVPAGLAEVERGFRIIAVVGTLDFAQTGIVASLSAPLAAAGISIFGISTYDTDHILVREDHIEDAVHALEAAGHTFR